MASCSATLSSSHIKRYDVFSSFHGKDVRKGFLSHLHSHFASRGITTFKDGEIERGHSIAPELFQAIRESRVLMVVLSKNYASSSWCLDELVEILKCQEDHNVMTIFYDVDPSSVRKQKGDFGKAFDKTCEEKSEEVKQRWRKALTDVANLEGEHSANWVSEAEMIKRIATDVSNKLNVTPYGSRDFEGKVGLEAHLKKLNSMLCLGGDDVKMIGIWGPAGIGKSTIARALYTQLSSSFQLKCFMGNLKGSLKSKMGVDEYESMSSLQNLLLSKILGQNIMVIHHLETIKERLHDQRVLIILDDVDDLEQLEVLAKEPSWFGSGSRIIVTTQDKKIFKAHKILWINQDVYHVDYPSKEEALEILCLSAFKQRSVPDGFEDLADKVAEFCGYLPLGLCVVGSSLCGESKQEWELQLSTRIEGSVVGKIESVLRIGFDKLSKKDQSLFLHIACFFNNDGVGHVTSMVSDSHLDVEYGLKILTDKSLVHINYDGHIVMHQLLQNLGRQINREGSKEPGKRQFLLEAKEIRDVLRDKTGTRSVLAISYDADNTLEVSVSKEAFEGMRNLRYLRICDNIFGEQSTLQIPKDMEYLPRLRLLHWNNYLGKNLPPRFQPEHLVEIHMPFSGLKKLWGGIQPLPNLKSIDLSYSFSLKELPNLSKATNLETLRLGHCSSLVKLWDGILLLPNLTSISLSYANKLKEIPNISDLAKLETLRLEGCSNIRLVKLWDGIQPLPNLKSINLSDCSKLKEIPNLSKATNLKELILRGCKRLVELPSYISNLHKLKRLDMQGCSKLQVIPTNINLASLEMVDMSDCSRLRTFPDISKHIIYLNVSNTKIKEVPPSIVGLSRLRSLQIGTRSLKRLTIVPKTVTHLNLSNTDIKRIPDCVTTLPHLKGIDVRECPKLVTIQALPPSLEYLNASGCVSLERVCCSFHNPLTRLTFFNCFKLDEEARRGIIEQSVNDYICLPGKEIPVEFTHKSIGNSVTIPLAPGTFTASSRFKACVLMLPLKGYRYNEICCSLRSKGGVTVNIFKRTVYFETSFPSEHLFILHGDFREGGHEVDVTMSEITIEFSCLEKDEEKIIECGVQIMTEEPEGSSINEVDNFEPESSSNSEVDSNETGGNNNHHTDEDYEAEGVESSQVEYIKTSKHSGVWSGLRKLRQS